MFTGALEAGNQSEQLGVAIRHHLRFPLRERPRFVEDDGVHLFHRLQRLCVLDQYASMVSLPTRSARITSDPFPFAVAPITREPAAFSTGIDSPVIMDSSTALDPPSTTPSTGTFSPGRTRSLSPAFTCSSRISRSDP